jgi:hypothetical protein
MFKISALKFQGFGKYNTLNFTRGVKDMDAEELGKIKTLAARMSLEYKDCYNPLRLNENFISVSVLNASGVRPEPGMFYNTTIKMQKYQYNGKTKLRALVSVMKVANKSLVFEDA